MIIFLIFREACIVQQRGPGEAAAIVSAEGGVIDAEIISLTARLTIIYSVALFVCYVIVDATGDGAAMVMVWALTLLYFLPILGRKWNPDGGPHHLMYFVRLSVLPGALLFLLPRTALPYILKIWAPDNVTFVYPLFLSFVEFLVVSAMLNYRVVVGYNDEALYLVAHVVLSMFESSRIGMLVVVANSPRGTFGGLINATIVGLVRKFWPGII